MSKKKRTGKTGKPPLSRSRKAAEDKAIKKAAKDVSTSDVVGKIEPKSPPAQQSVSYETALNMVLDAFDSKNPDVKFTCPPGVWKRVYEPAIGLLVRGVKILDTMAKEAE